MTPRYDEVAAEWRSDGDWVEQVDEALPEEAAVLQLPYVPFPSSPPVGRMVDYDQVRPYLHSDDLRWSYGAMKGRPEDVGDDVESPAQAEALGLRRRRVDRFGYPDNGAAVEARAPAVDRRRADRQRRRPPCLLSAVSVLDRPLVWEASRAALDLGFGLYRRRQGAARPLGAAGRRAEHPRHRLRDRAVRLAHRRAATSASTSIARTSSTLAGAAATSAMRSAASMRPSWWPRASASTSC